MQLSCYLGMGTSTSVATVSIPWWSIDSSRMWWKLSILMLQFFLNTCRKVLEFPHRETASAPPPVSTCLSSHLTPPLPASSKSRESLKPHICTQLPDFLLFFLIFITLLFLFLFSPVTLMYYYCLYCFYIYVCGAVILKVLFHCWCFFPKTLH